MSRKTSSSQIQQKLSNWEERPREKWIPPLSALLVLAASLLTDFSYWYLDQMMTLLFYAILVQVWTEVGSVEPISRDRDWCFVEFVLMAAGAVIFGSVLRTGVESVTGELLAVQSLALAVIVGRLYNNWKATQTLSLRGILRYRDAFDRYLILTPCLLTFLLPMVHQKVSFQLFTLETTSGFLKLTTLSVLGGFILYMYETENL